MEKMTRRAFTWYLSLWSTAICYLNEKLFGKKWETVQDTTPNHGNSTTLPKKDWIDWDPPLLKSRSLVQATWKQHEDAVGRIIELLRKPHSRTLFTYKGVPTAAYEVDLEQNDLGENMGMMLLWIRNDENIILNPFFHNRYPKAIPTVGYPPDNICFEIVERKIKDRYTEFYNLQGPDETVKYCTDVCQKFGNYADLPKSGDPWLFG